MIRAVIFDIGGVLAFDVWEHMFLDKPNGLSSILRLPENEIKNFGNELWKNFAYTPAETGAEVKKLEAEYWNQFIKHFDLKKPVDYFLKLTDKFIRPVEGTRSLLQKLKQEEIELAICSNNNEFFFRRQMKKLGFGEFFPGDKIALSSRVGFSKSSPNFEMFSAVLYFVNKRKEQCLFIDDKVENINKAVEFGLPAILFPSESKSGANYLEILFKQMDILKDEYSYTFSRDSHSLVAEKS